MSTRNPAPRKSSKKPAARKSSSKKEIAGVLSVFQTPYHADESIDAATLEKEIHWIYDHGADGIVMAMVSETLRLSTEERHELAKLACKYGNKRGVVVISCGAESSILAERFAKQAQDVGADALMAIPPVSIGVGEAELLSYYRRILEAVKIPLVVQDASGYVGRPMPIAMQARLLEEYGDRILYKPEANPIGPRLSDLRDATGGKARVFEGTGGIALVDSYRRGVVGTMPGAEIIFALVALWRALEAGDEKRIYQLSFPISSLIAVQTSLDAFLAVEKYLLVKQGIFKNTHVRGPVGYKLDEETRHEVDRLFDLITQAVEAAEG
ncbi:MAG: dihydrodipicolinate synthase family protein [Planctomycetota bacterium]|nr:dihydrodipicolinate synthase family protein [Planctomycetota bacterium]